ncbi:hypothetical protein QOZ80_8AG0633130 [Eleusine coracana subsp. coracana]|nr:hypothetical protein QOZ80_8AG0633130 [Eleusine coracana subsp. coracana]
MALFISIIWPGPPSHQPVGDLRTAKSAILLGFVSSLISPAYMQCCLSDGRHDVEQQEMYYQLANFVLAMLGVALLAVDRQFSMAAPGGSPLPPTVVKWMVWLAKVLTGCTVHFDLIVLHLCLKSST